MSTDSVTGARWDAIKSRFDEILALDLLEHAATGDFLETPADVQALLEPGSRDEIGNWRLLRLIDGGETRNGNPYLVMEFVDGTPITACASASGLPVPARLQLVVAALDAGGAIPHRTRAGRGPARVP